jgi:hypothetical protein
MHVQWSEPGEHSRKSRGAEKWSLIAETPDELRGRGWVVWGRVGAAKETP